MNILFVEDSPAAIALLVSNIREVDSDTGIFIARNLSEAKTYLDDESIDLAIIDLFVPGDLGPFRKYVQPGEDTFMKEGQFFARYCKESNVRFLVYSNVRQAWIPDGDIDEDKVLFDKSPEGTKKILAQIRTFLNSTGSS